MIKDHLLLAHHKDMFEIGCRSRERPA